MKDPIIQQFIQQINLNNPKCPYCLNKLINNSPLRKSYNLFYYCNFCSEDFSIFKSLNDIGGYYAFNFSCKKLMIVYTNYTKIRNGFAIKNRNDFNNNFGMWTDIPDITLDFSNKDKLYNRLKTCFVFA